MLHKTEKPVRGPQKYSRTSSICPTPDEVLWEACKNNDIDTIERIVIENPQLLQYNYKDPPETTAFLRCCLDEGINEETVKKLIDLGANLNDTYDGLNALHLAAQNAKGKILEILLKQHNRININDITYEGGNTALHTLLSNEDNKDNPDFIKCAQLLIRNGIDINKGNKKNFSPILIAARKGYKDIIKIIIEESIGHVDLDTHKLPNGKTARDLIIDKRLYNRPLPEPNIINNNNPNELLMTYLNTNNEDAFVSLIEKYPNLNNIDDGGKSLLQLATEKGFVKAVKILANKVDVNLTEAKGERLTALELAAKAGYYNIVEILLENPNTKVTPQILCELLKYDLWKNINNHGVKIDGIDHEKCCEIIMKAIKDKKAIVDINGVDEKNNTPLHYAIRFADQDKVEDLLKLGASLAHKNNFGVMPIQNMEPQTLENHLNNCIKFVDDNEKRADNEDFEVIFDFTTLVPPQRKEQTIDEEDPLHTPIMGYVNETEAIHYMSQTNEFRHLLQHPVIVTFLLMKWFKIRWLFYANLSFYFTFVISLFCFIFFYYGNFDDNRDTIAIIVLHIAIIVLWITFILLVLRELFQMAISRNYFKHFENYIELCLIVVVSLILIIKQPTDDTRRQLSSVAILLAAFGLILLMGQHPKMSTNVVMLRRVSLNFFQLLSWYSVLILAFALSFNILFSKTIENNGNSPNNGTVVDGDEDGDSFTGPGKSIFKTIIMLTGEFDASSINFHTYPVISKIIFSMFIFMITIILLNLLNGLAVSDTQAIKNEAELVGLICRVQHIYYVESMVLGNILPTNLIKFIQNVCCCCPFDPSRTLALAKPLAKYVCLGPNYEFRIYPNDHGRIALGKSNKKYIIMSGLCLDRDTALKTNQIIQDRRRTCNNNLSLGELRNAIIEVQTRLEELLKKLPQKH